MDLSRLLRDYHSIKNKTDTSVYNECGEKGKSCNKKKNFFVHQPPHETNNTTV